MGIMGRPGTVMLRDVHLGHVQRQFGLELMLASPQISSPPDGPSVSLLTLCYKLFSWGVLDACRRWEAGGLCMAQARYS